MASANAEKIKRILADKSGEDISKIKDESFLADDLGLDSLDIVELWMEIEKEFSVSIPDEIIGTLKTVSALTAFVEGVLSQR